MSESADGRDGFEYRRVLTGEILAMWDIVRGWQGAGQRFGIPVDLEADRALGDAVRYLTDAAAALDPATGLGNPPAAGVFVSVDLVGRSRVQAVSTAADRSRLVRDSRRFAETVRPSVRGLTLYEVVRAFGDGVKFRGVAVPDEYSPLARVGDAALRYRAHCCRFDRPGGQP